MAGNNLADGTRFMRVKFNETVQSLPYSTKFSTTLGPEYFWVIHDKQVKVCRMCIQPGHTLRECLEFMCHKCGVQGHYARECMKAGNCCKVCLNEDNKCICNASDSEVLIDLVSESEEGSEIGGKPRQIVHGQGIL